MPAVTRKGDMSTGHQCWPPRQSIEASPNVFANFIPVHRQGDKWLVHCCGDKCHTAVLQQGSPTVFVNHKQIGRINDPLSCNPQDRVAVGSPNVFAGDKGGAGGGDARKQDVDMAVSRTYGSTPDQPILSGPSTMRVGETKTFRITNFDEKNTYNIQPLDTGAVSIAGDLITFTAPLSEQTTTGFKVLTKGPDYDGFGSISILEDGTFIGRLGEVLGTGVVLPNGNLAFLGTSFKALLGMQNDIHFADGVVGYLRDGLLKDVYGNLLGQIQEVSPGVFKLITTSYGEFGLSELANTKDAYHPDSPGRYDFDLNKSFAPTVETDGTVHVFGQSDIAKPDLQGERNDNPLDYYVYTKRDNVPVGEGKYFYRQVDGKLDGAGVNSNVEFSGGDVWNGYREEGAPGGSLKVTHTQFPQEVEKEFVFPLELWPVEVILPEEVISLCYKQLEFTPVLRGILFGHTYWWDQISGDTSTVTWLTPRDQKDVVIDFGTLKVDRVFRFYVDKGRSTERYADIKVYGTPIDKGYSAVADLKFLKDASFLSKFKHTSFPIMLTKRVVDEMNIPFNQFND